MRLENHPRDQFPTSWNIPCLKVLKVEDPFFSNPSPDHWLLFGVSDPDIDTSLNPLMPKFFLKFVVCVMRL